MSKLIPLLIALLNTVSMAFYVAILESYSEKNVLTHSEKMFITDKLREEATKVLPAYMGHTIMTRENIATMLPPGKNIEDCDGICLVETGRNISADFVAQARIGKFNKKYTITVELYETSSSKLVSSFTIMSTNSEELIKDISSKSMDLFGKIQSNVLINTKNEGKTELTIKKIPSQTITEKKKFAEYRLDALILTSSFKKDELKWNFIGAKDLKIIVDENRIAQILAPHPYWHGSETITFVVTDPTGHVESTPVTFTVLSVNDAPILYCNNFSIVYYPSRLMFNPIKLSDFSFDADHSTEELKWTYKGNEDLVVVIDENSIAKVSVPYSGWKGSETITYYVTDPDGASAQCKVKYAVY